MARMEIVTGRERRRRWSQENKLQILQEAATSGLSVAEVARRHDVVPQQIYIWRRQLLAKARADAGVHGASPRFLPVAVVSEPDQPDAPQDIEAAAAETVPPISLVREAAPQDQARAPASAGSSAPHEVVHEAGDCACPTRGGRDFLKAGTAVSEMLDYVPASFRVLRHIQPRLVCKGCDTEITAAIPSAPIERGKPSPGLIAHVLTAKYCDHLPLYRQSEIYAREGIDLARSTMADWVGKASALLTPLIAALRSHVFAGDRLHGDDTPVPVLEPGRGKTKTGRLWTYVRDGRPRADKAPPAVCYFYSPDRKANHPRAHLKGFRGILHADGYGGFKELYETKKAGGLHGPCPAQVLRPDHQPRADCGRSAAADWRVLRY
jgi:transposase